jgi:predicted glycosyltransferase
MKRIWIDLDNSPHVPLFRPVVKELNRRNVECIITARDFAQTISLLRLWGVPFQKIGKHGGKNKFKKVINLFVRANELRNYIRDKSIDLALSHGSRTQLVAAKFSGIKSVVMMDYEYTESRIFNYLSNYMLIPEYIPDSRLESVNINTGKILKYPGFKEELYLNSFSPEMDFRSNLNIDNQKVLVTIRPSAMVGNYHDATSETILLKIMEKLIVNKDVYPLIISRTSEDRDLLQSNFGGKVHFLKNAIDGLQLIWNSDVFISGGGSMNREAALLGVPAYSIFTGRKPYLDEYLQEKGKLTFIDTVEKIDLINISKREIADKYNNKNTDLVKKVVDIILSL